MVKINVVIVDKINFIIFLYNVINIWGSMILKFFIMILIILLGVGRIYFLILFIEMINCYNMSNLRVKNIGINLFFVFFNFFINCNVFFFIVNFNYRSNFGCFFFNVNFLCFFYNFKKKI